MRCCTNSTYILCVLNLLKQFSENRFAVLCCCQIITCEQLSVCFFGPLCICRPILIYLAPRYVQQFKTELFIETYVKLKVR